MPHDELQRCLGKTNTMFSADIIDAPDAVEDLWRCPLIIIISPIDRAGCQDAGVIRASQNDANIAFHAHRQETLERFLLKQRVAAADEEAMQVAQIEQSLANFPRIHS